MKSIYWIEALPGRGETAYPHYALYLCQKSRVEIENIEFRIKTKIPRQSGSERFTSSSMLVSNVTLLDIMSIWF